MRNLLILSLLIGCAFTSKLLSRNLQAANATNATTSNVTVGSADMSKNASLIPQVFYVDINGKPGHDFIALKSNDGLYLKCDKDGVLSLADKNVTKDDLFVPVKLDDKHIALRHYLGGYVGYNNTKFNCISRKLDEIHRLELVRDFDLSKLNLNNVSDKDMVLLFKVKDGYLGSKDKKIALVKDMSKDVAWIAPFKKDEIKNVPEGKNYIENIMMEYTVR
jgi:hypothetical protein